MTGSVFNRAVRLLVLCVLFRFLRTAASAGAREFVFSGADSPSPDGGAAWETILDALPEDARAELNDLRDPASAPEALAEKTGFAWLGNRIADAFSASAGRLFPDAAPIFGSLLLLAAARLAIPSEAMAEGLGRLSRLWLTVFVFRLAAEALVLTKTSLGVICRVMELTVPVMEGTALFSGRLTEKTVAAGGMMLASTLVNEANAALLAPLSGLLLGLTAAEAAFGGPKGLAEAVKKALMRLWQLLTLCVSFMLGTQTVLARAADTLGLKTARFALSSFVPVAGSALAEALASVRSGASLLRATAGIGGMLALILLLLPLLAPLVTAKIVFSLAQSAAEALNLPDGAKILAGAHGLIDLLLGFSLHAALMFFLSLAAFCAGGAAGP